MTQEQRSDLTGVSFMLKALKSWLLCAAVLVSVCSCVVHFARFGTVFVGYAASAISFICAAAAGAAAHRCRGGGAFFTGAVTGIALTVFLLTLGYIIRGSDIDASCIISVASFSLTGALTGSVMFGRNRRSTNAVRRTRKPKNRKKRA